MKLDMHVHSVYSSDGEASPRDILKKMKALGFGGLSITDHNTLEGNAEARKIAGEFGLIVVRGMEISSAEGHILAYGIDEEIPKDLSPEETFASIRDQGGLATVAHPFRYWTGLGEERTRESKPDVIEVLNAHSTGKDNLLSRKLCESMGLPMTAGSDGHTLEEMGKAYIEISDAANEEEVLEAIRKEEVRAIGENRNLAGALKDRTQTVTQWVGRGFRKM